MDDDTSYCCKAMDDARAEIASLRAQNELTHVAYVEENNRLMAERENLRAELAAANDRIEHMSKVMVDAEELLGVEETGELILRPIERLKAELAAAKRELDDAEEARNDAETRLLANLTAARQDAEALDRYRYAVAFAAADAWDCGPDMRYRFEWARANDPGGHLTNDRVAEIGGTFPAEYRGQLVGQDAEEKARLRDGLQTIADGNAGQVPSRFARNLLAALACRPQEKDNG